MTLGNTTNETTGVGTGSQTVFPFNFAVHNAGQVKVFTQTGTADPAEKFVGPDFAISLYPNTDGGEVTFTSPPALGVNVIMHRTPDYLQQTAFPLNRNLDERALERALDKLTMQDQDLGQAILRSLRFPFGTSSSVSGILPPVSARAGKALGFDGLGNISMYDTTNLIDTTIIATGTLTSRSLADRLSKNSRWIDVRDMGAVGDGYIDGSDHGAGTSDLAAFQAALDKGGNVLQHTIVYVPPGTYRLGTDTTNNLESILQFHTNTTLILDGAKLIHCVNNGLKGAALISPDNIAETDTGSRLDNVHVHFINGAEIYFPTRTITQNRKAVNILHCDRWSLTGLMCTGDDQGSFNVTIVHSNKGLVAGCNILSGDSIGEDGLHILGNSDSIVVTGNVVYAGDDAFSITQETSNRANCTIKNITVCNNVFFVTSTFTAIKILNDSGASNSTIKDVFFSNNILGQTASGGALVNINNTSTAGNVIDNIVFRNTMGDMTGGGSSGAAVECYRSTNIDFGNFTLKGLSGRGFFLQDNTHVKIGHGSYIGGYTKQTTKLTGLVITDATWTSTATMRFTLSGSPDLSTLSASTDYIDVTGCANAINNGRFNVASFDNTAKTITVNTTVTRLPATDETGLTAAGTVVVRKDTDYAIQNGGTDHLTIEGVHFDNPGSLAYFGQLGSDGVQPHHVTIRNNRFTRCTQDTIIQITSGRYNRIEGNEAINCSANVFIYEVSSTDAEYNEIYNNTDKGETSTCRMSFRITRATCKHRNNRGNNSDILSGTATIASAATTTTIDVGPSIYAESISANINLKHLSFFANGDTTTAKALWATLSGTTFTLRTNTAPGADLNISYRIEKPE